MRKGILTRARGMLLRARAACLEGAHEAQHGLAAADEAGAALQRLLDDAEQLAGRAQHVRLHGVLHRLPALLPDQGLERVSQPLLLRINVHPAKKMRPSPGVATHLMLPQNRSCTCVQTSINNCVVLSMHNKRE